MAEPPRCESHRARGGLPCVLPAGHEGWHKADYDPETRGGPVWWLALDDARRQPTHA